MKHPSFPDHEFSDEISATWFDVAMFACILGGHAGLLAYMLLA